MISDFLTGSHTCRGIGNKIRIPARIRKLIPVCNKSEYSGQENQTGNPHIHGFPVCSTTKERRQAVTGITNLC